MIKKVTIQNFQSHRDTEVELSPGVNVITGQSDSGKSAILRALQWALWNRPSGFSFKSSFANDKEPTRVKIDFCDGKWLERIRGKNVNEYRLDGLGNLKAIGVHMPDEVIQVHKMDDINFQSQFDQHFLLHDSPGEVARKLNEIVGLDVIDRILKRINSLASTSKTQLLESESRIEDLEKEIDQYRFLDELEVEIDEIEKAIEKEENCQRMIERISDILDSFQQIDRQLERFSSINEIESSYLDLIEEVRKLDDLSFQAKVLEETIEEIENSDGKIEELNERIRMEGEVEGLLELAGELDKTRKDEKLLKSLLSALEDAQKTISKWTTKMNNLIEEYVVLLEEIKACPVCGSPISKDCIKRIKQGLVN